MEINQQEEEEAQPEMQMLMVVSKLQVPGENHQKSI